jgi:pimeloyl-ACP methyl ester carboxylesterase
MKKRARTIGEGGMHNFLKNLQHATVQNGTRIHLMGHSFGTIVVSGMAGGPGAEGPLPRPVDSLVLVQGAVSLWSYGSQIPFGNAGPGYFNRILKDRKILGPIVTTQSRYDDAVGVFYPLASRLKGSASFAGLPEFGAIGAYGIQGVIDTMPQELAMLQVDNPYKFEKGNIYNLDGSQFICHKEGASGAHSDIAGPEVAHAIWAAAFASVPASAVTAA